MTPYQEQRDGCGFPLFWRGCYTGTFDLINPESYAHPAKMSPALCYRILQHLQELGLLKENDTILDPMGGTGITNICAGAMGYKSVSVELEEKFVNFQKQNKEYASRKLYKPLDWQIIQGDSRRLSELLQGNGNKTVMSPPYTDTLQGCGADSIRKRIAEGKYIGKRPDVWISEGNKAGSTYGDNYSKDPANIGNLKDIPLKSITSLPYGEAINTDKCGIDFSKTKLDYPGRVWHEGRIKQHKERSDNMTYGQSSGQIGSLPDKPLKSVMSPPYDNRMPDSHNNIANIRRNHHREDYYGSAAGQIANEETESYLSAMSQVYREISKVSDVLAVVIKNPTRNKQLRRLDLDTIRILQETGWSIHCQHRALLFEELEQADLFGNSQKKVKGRMSFFKRLSWQNGQPVASWEDCIFCIRKGD